MDSMLRSRRSFIKAFLLMLASPILSLKAAKMTYLKNHQLKTVKKNFTGNPYVDGTFQNLYGRSGVASLLDIIKWKLSKNPKKEIKESETYQLKVVKNSTLLEKKEDYICWLGHATFLIQIDGKKIITDPCLTAPPFIKRYTQLPIKIQKIKPDYLLISHGHYDHLDSDTIEQLDNTTALSPLNMTKLIKGMNSTITVQEAGWYQQYDISEKFEIFFLPAHHWHKRGIMDKDEILWGSFLIKTKNKTIYFAGDSGYSQHFKDIHEVFGEIDMAILPIGAYEPRWFMRTSHISPAEAITAHKDLHAKELIPMHFGTFDLSDEPLGEPEQLLREIGRKENIRFLTIGKEENII
jgi:L-ascorbate metabolism protein UlaG (beta-lactamase superfamily)